ncbi:proline-rich receptor-like protein kinase PERK8 [Brachypodium distachyon]|uniref:Protein kinase domain-containing protein n=1 Tax=Brachypodium distachyon TaxID=15368 RepID=A0A0Q3FET0_BRADI|nr:proline-rich receptor-like protein kinase PERK8 [Brachypodium distachyon]KQJ98143.1 hypothetical protein BRADI_3g35130v3 [Brachypodium distachyon]|eukprot:XP_010236679.1 proline-rich receptor-like protein kinase PERK8 [Brachypodium distachyon]
MHGSTAALDAVHHAVVAAVAAAFVALAAALLLLLWRRKKRMAGRGPGAPHGLASSDEAPAAQALPLPVVPLADVERATDGFHSSRVIGQGPHFTVYALAAASPGARDQEAQLAAKRMRPHLILGDPGGRRFPPSVRSLPILPRHPNLAALVGLSEGPGERVLLVQRAPAGSRALHALLHDDKHPPLTWRRRAAVAAGAARGLAHLHAHGVPHGRVRPCNVLVVAAAVAGGARAVVCDYGLAGFLGDVVRAEEEDDVYMFGALLLEVMTGRRWDGGRLAGWALPLIRRGGIGVSAEDRQVLLDARAGKADLQPRLLARMARVALACVGNSDARSRPGMAEVSAILDDVDAAYGRCRDDGVQPEEDGGEERHSGCLLGPGRSAHKAEMLLRNPV